MYGVSLLVPREVAHNTSNQTGTLDCGLCQNPGNPGVGPR